jgi:hypothetical protein
MLVVALYSTPLFVSFCVLVISFLLFGTSHEQKYRPFFFVHDNVECFNCILSNVMHRSRPLVEMCFFVVGSLSQTSVGTVQYMYEALNYYYSIHVLIY